MRPFYATLIEDDGSKKEIVVLNIDNAFESMVYIDKKTKEVKSFDFTYEDEDSKLIFERFYHQHEL